MKLRFSLLLLTIGLWLSPTLALAGVEQISEKEFKQLAEEIAPKVNLFAEGWAQDPKAEFYGGTTRDYLYWLKGQFKDAQNKKDAEKIVAQLKAEPIIDVRSFIIGDSDVDIISTKSVELDPDAFGVRKIDSQSPDLLNASTEMGKNERLQGYIPAEKIRLGRDGIQTTDLGDGLHEIYEGKLTVQFASAEDFAKSKYAKEGINHPILLALRYLRLQAINYYRSHGSGFPDMHLLHAGMDEQSAANVQRVIRQVIATGELEPYLKKNKFKSWINGAIQKAFRSYTNPTAALELMKEFGVDTLPGRHPDHIDPINQYVFTKFRDPAAIAKALKENNIDPKQFYSPPGKYFTDGKLYHGTPTEEAFRGILFQGILPSQIGNAGGGLYGVAEKDKKFSEGWAGDKDRLLSFEVRPDAKLVDITEGEGKRIWERLGNGKMSEDAFAEKFGIDIIRYPYDAQAFVVKNSGALEPGQGVYRTVKTISEIIAEAASLDTPGKVIRLLSVNQVTSSERRAVWDASKITTEKMLKFIAGKKSADEMLNGIKGSHWVEDPKIETLLRQWLQNPDAQKRRNGLRGLLTSNHPSAGLISDLDKILIDRNWAEDWVFSNRIPLPLLQYLSNNQIAPVPNAVEYTLAEIEKMVATNPGVSLSDSEHPYPKLLERFSFSATQSKRLFRALARLNGEEDSSISYFIGACANALIRGGHPPEELKPFLINKLLDSLKGTPRITDLWQYLGPLQELMPGSKELRALQIATLKKVAEKPYDWNWLKDLAQPLADDKEAKKTILSLLKDPNGLVEDLRKAVVLFQLNDSELAAFVNAAAQKHEQMKKVIREYLPNHLEDIGPKTAVSIVKAYSNTDPGSVPTLSDLRALKEQLNKNPEGINKFLLKELSGGERIRGDGWTRPPHSHRQILAALGDIFPATEELREKVLSVMESEPKGRPNYALTGQDINRIFAVKDPGTSLRLQSLITEDKLNVTYDLAFLETAEKMPSYSPTFFEFIQWNVFQRQLDPAYAQLPEAPIIDRILARAPAGTNPISCAAEFAEINR